MQMGTGTGMRWDAEHVFASVLSRRWVAVQVQESADVSVGGIMLPDSAKEKPIAGRVVRVGPGKREKDGSRKEPKVKEGDSVLYFKWAGDQMETPSGEHFVVVHESDILCRT